MSLSSSHILRGRMRIRGRRGEEEDEVVREKRCNRGREAEERGRDGGWEGAKDRKSERVREEVRERGKEGESEGGSEAVKERERER